MVEQAVRRRENRRKQEKRRKKTYASTLKRSGEINMK